MKDVKCERTGSAIYRRQKKRAMNQWMEAATES